MRTDISASFLLLALLVSLPRLASAQTPTAVTSIVNGAQDTTLEVNHNGSLLMPGTRITDGTEADSIPVTGAGTRLMWYPAKAAFRAGEVSSSNWDPGNIGIHSAALGFNTTASGSGAAAIGRFTTASGESAVASGHITTAATDHSLSIGECNSANTSADGTLFVAGNGAFDVLDGSCTRSDAMVLKKNGQLTTAASIESESGGFVLPDGTVLDEAGDLEGLPTNSNGAFNLSNEDGLVASGSFDSGSVPTTGAGTRLMWHPAKAAFRAGRVGVSSGKGDVWDSDSVGSYSVALGADTKASGGAATAMGLETTASADQATAMGFDTNASGGYATAMGFQSIASGTWATAMGIQTRASGDAATAMGNGTVASGAGALAMGFETSATGTRAAALGERAAAGGLWSVAMGRGTVANTNRSLSVGQCNSANSSPDNTLFVVGNGAFDSSTGSCTRSDALVLGETGNLTISGSLTESSDRRLKTQVEPLKENVLQSVSRLRPVRFEFKNQQTRPSGEQIGFVAQDVREEFPSLVSKGASGYLSLAYPKMTAVLLKGMQEQQATIDSLKKQTRRLDRVEKRLAALETERSPSALAGLTGSAGGLLLAFLLGGLLGAGLLWRRRG